MRLLDSLKAHPTTLKLAHSVKRAAKAAIARLFLLHAGGVQASAPAMQKASYILLVHRFYKYPATKLAR
jgi:hypothetical protein